MDYQLSVYIIIIVIQLMLLAMHWHLLNNQTTIHSSILFAFIFVYFIWLVVGVVNESRTNLCGWDICIPNTT